MVNRSSGTSPSIVVKIEAPQDNKISPDIHTTILSYNNERAICTCHRGDYFSPELESAREALENTAFG